MSQTFETQFGGRTLTIETGKLARLAGGSVTVRYGDTMVLGTANRSEPRPGLDFFPLTVDFEERMYAAGKIPGGFIKREARPSENAILAARQTDRPIRPLFPEGYKDDIQLVITVLSTDQENNPDVLGTVAASAALTISEIPFNGPIGAVRVGRIDGEFVVNPTYSAARGLRARPDRRRHARRDHDGRGRRQAPARGRHGRGHPVRPPLAPAAHRPPGGAPEGGRQAQAHPVPRAAAPARSSTSSPAIDAKREFVVVDVETTGTDPKMADLVEIAAVKVKGGKIIDRWSTFVKPARPIVGNQMHGITDKDVARRPRRPTPRSKPLKFIGDALVVGHNVGFDLGFIEEALGDGTRFEPGRYLDTLVIAREGYPDLQNYKLDDAVGVLRHRALPRTTAPCRTPRRPPTSCCGSRTTCRAGSRRCATSIADAVRAQRTGGDTNKLLDAATPRGARQQEPVQPRPEEDRPPRSSSTRASGSTAAA